MHIFDLNNLISLHGFRAFSKMRPGKIQFLLSPLIVAALSFATVPAFSQPSCNAVFSQSEDTITIPDTDYKKLTQKFGFDLEEFSSSKETFLNLLREGRESEIDKNLLDQKISSDLQMAALFEAYNEFKGNDFFSWLSATAKNPKHNKKFARIAKVLRADDAQVTVYDFSNFLEDLYDISNQPPKKWLQFLRPGVSRLTKKREQLEAARGELLPILKNLGIIRNNGIWSRVRQKQKEYKNYEKLAMAGLLHYASAHFLGGHVFIPPYLPKLDLHRTVPTTSVRFSKVLSTIDIGSIILRRHIYLGVSSAFLLAGVIAGDITIKSSYQYAQHTYEESIEAFDSLHSAYILIFYPDELNIPANVLKHYMGTPRYHYWSSQYKLKEGHDPDIMDEIQDRASWLAFAHLPMNPGLLRKIRDNECQIDPENCR